MEDKKSIETELKVGNVNYICSCSDKGEWTYKADFSSKKPKPKAKYKERPRYKVLEEIDEKALSFAKKWHKSLSKAVTEAFSEN